MNTRSPPVWTGLAAIPLLLITGSVVMAADGHAAHHGTVPAATAGLTLSGDYAFASIAEIITLLDTDPATDWAAVDIPALREHLVDMHLVMIDSRVESRVVDAGIEHRVTGDGARTIDAIRRMASAHGRTLVDTTFEYTVLHIERGVQVTLATDDPVSLARLQGLGFQGLLALGDHHRRHHLSMARGADPH